VGAATAPSRRIESARAARRTICSRAPNPGRGSTRSRRAPPRRRSRQPRAARAHESIRGITQRDRRRCKHSAGNMRASATAPRCRRSPRTASALRRRRSRTANRGGAGESRAADREQLPARPSPQSPHPRPPISSRHRARPDRRSPQTRVAVPGNDLSANATGRSCPKSASVPLRLVTPHEQPRRS